MSTHSNSPQLLPSAAFFALGLVAGAPSFAGTVLEVWRYDLATNARDSTVTIVEQDGNLRLEQIDEEGATTILLYVDGDIYDIDLQTHSYARLERARLDAARATSNPTQALRQDLLQEVPAARREHSLHIMNTPGSLTSPDGHGKVSYAQTHQYRVAANGERCRIEQVLVNGALRYDYCLSLQADPGTSRLMQTSEAMADLVRVFHETLGMVWQTEALAVYWSHAYELDGFPLIVREYADRRPLEEFRVMKLESRDVEPATFKLPRGLQYRGIVDFGWEPGTRFDTGTR